MKISRNLTCRGLDYTFHINNLHYTYICYRFFVIVIDHDSILRILGLCFHILSNDPNSHR